MERKVSCIEENGVIKASPETLLVNPGDTIRWENQLSEAYRATNFSPQDPPLFEEEVIEIPAGLPSVPVLVEASPRVGESVEYHYLLEPVNPEMPSVDPVIVVESPANPPQSMTVQGQSNTSRL
ncbi:MAG TPA: hypothetical protein VG759_10310 [Candidatus Angelobacter sp.]|jgi:hypothetical protein|nr:hypothetical protein [Candidatus Angelobacter sp.]